MAAITSFHSELAHSYRNVLAGVLAQRPSTTADELRELIAQYPPLGGLTLTELLGGVAKPASTAAAKPAKRASAKPKAAGKAKAAAKPQPVAAAAAKPVAAAAAKPRSAKPAAAGGWNVRTEEGRAQLREAVLEGLRQRGGSNVRAEQLSHLGATPAQLRTTLNVLIQDGAVSYSGRARGTRYSLV